ncbi:pectate lyase [Lophium mytilinum]|uniref:Pectate lyase n=1 Tax=Lophium mytilinum TaxID=390894 RepID=A0A6A6QL82_9PEZI|nr:pectate lyase [Lophium mytilinum]
MDNQVCLLFFPIFVASWFCIATAATTNTNLQSTFPASSGTTNLAAVKTIAASATFDGGMLQWLLTASTCNEQAEGGDSDAVFLLQDGAVLSNVVIGPNNGEGIHCLGSCTLNNVWWTDLCEDAATFKQSSGTSYVNGGGARNAEDIVLQHNGGGMVAVKNFYAENIGKHARTSTFTNIKVDGADVVAGVNGNEGDTTTISNSCILDSSICWLYKGVDDESEPTKTASGPDGTVCATSSIKTSGC